MTDSNNSQTTQTAQTTSAQTQQTTSQTDATAADKSSAASATKEGGAKEETQLLFEETKKGDEQPGDKKDEADKSEDKKDGDQPDVVKLEELTLPEEIQISEEMKAPLTDFITSNKLNKEQAQALTDLGVKLQQQNINAWAETKKGWRDEVVADPDLGGKNLENTVNNANKVIRQFAGSEEHLAELKQDLVLLGLGNKKSFVRFLSNIAKATGNDSIEGNSGSGAKSATTFEEKAKRMYPDMN